MKDHILIVEDEVNALQALTAILTDEGFAVSGASRGTDGLDLALKLEPDLILLDIRLPDLDGLTILERLRAGYSNAAVIIMTAETSSSNAIRATKLGAFDYIAKPINDEHLRVVIARALEYRRLESELKKHSPQVGAGPNGMIGHSVGMQSVYKLIGRVADTAANVLIGGESGTGKELVASAIHEYSARARGPFIKVNCAAIPEHLLESELFGHEKGAFTNALARRIGRFEQANGGTLFLDEIAELPLALQAKLLRAIQERSIERLGGNLPIHIDFRLLAATAQDLNNAVAQGRFREDLFYRLNVVNIQIPPLRERREDIPLLIQRFLARSERPVQIRDDALEVLMQQDWPGNVRELENVITRAIVLAPGGLITPVQVQPNVSEASSEDWLSRIPLDKGYWATIRDVEAALVKRALTQAKGNKAEAARLLQIQRRLLYEKMNEFSLPDQ